MKYLALAILLMSSQAFAGPKLYVFDCGVLSLDSLEMFGLTEEESSLKEMFVPCYLIEHEKGRLLWDGGLPKAVAESDGPVTIEGGSMRYTRWIVDQLADMDLSASDITYAAYSHLHFDHAGAANFFLDGTVLMQTREWNAAFGGGEFVDTTLFDGLKEANIALIDGDHDVFGDGSVKLIFTPGHTPGHQALLVMLKNTGPILLSGDLYHTRANRRLRRVPTFNHDAEQTLESMARTEQLLSATGATLWIEHDKALADTLKMAPHYYD
ncbi:MAG: N-acyl homoserine lactonase family protein [Gammaproteobacteria bacterium]|nr:N-acyl homoserine lactonase family protein [Gammaproteobacteria bacterium]